MALNDKGITMYVDQLKKFLDSHRPLSEITVRSLFNDFALRYNYESNRIEGNNLTLVETRVFLEQGVTVKGKPFKDFLDVNNHRLAINYMMDLIDKKEPLSEGYIKKFNAILLKSTKDDQYAGVYRHIPITIAGSPHTPPQPYLIAPKMEELINSYHTDIAHPIEKIAKFHAKFEAIHPFIEGNGRTGRLIMNTELMKHGYPMAIIKSDDKDTYYEALIAADNGDYSLIINLITEEVENSIKQTLSVIDPEWPIKFEHYFSNEKER